MEKTSLNASECASGISGNGTETITSRFGRGDFLECRCLGNNKIVRGKIIGLSENIILIQDAENEFEMHFLNRQNLHRISIDNFCPGQAERPMTNSQLDFQENFMSEEIPSNMQPMLYKLRKMFGDVVWCQDYGIRVCQSVILKPPFDETSIECLDETSVHLSERIKKILPDLSSKSQSRETLITPSMDDSSEAEFLSPSSSISNCFNN